MLNKTALTIGLSVLISMDATPDDIELAHEAIDSFFAKASSSNGNGVVTSATLMTEGAGTVQTIQTEGTTAPAGAVELDKDGVPWDERIHSGATNEDGTRKKTDKGVWTKRRGVDDGLYKSVTAALKAAHANNTAAATTQVAAVTTALPGATIPLPGATTTLPALTPIAVVDPNFAELTALVGRNMRSPANPTGPIDDAWVKQSLVALGVPDGELQTLAAQPALVVNVLNAFRGAGLK